MKIGLREPVLNLQIDPFFLRELEHRKNPIETRPVQTTKRDLQRHVLPQSGTLTRRLPPVTTYSRDGQDPSDRIREVLEYLVQDLRR